MCRKRNTLAEVDKACEWVPTPGNPLVTLLHHEVKHRPLPKTGTRGRGRLGGVPPITTPRSRSQTSRLSLTATMRHTVKTLLCTKAPKGPRDKQHWGPSLIA